MLRTCASTVRSDRHSWRAIRLLLRRLLAQCVNLIADGIIGESTKDERGLAERPPVPARTGEVGGGSAGVPGVGDGAGLEFTPGQPHHQLLGALPRLVGQEGSQLDG